MTLSDSPAFLFFRKDLFIQNKGRDEECVRSKKGTGQKMGRLKWWYGPEKRSCANPPKQEEKTVCRRTADCNGCPFPAKYERVALALWTIGLDRDLEKYTLRRLGAEFTSTTEEESHMIRLIDPGNTLMQALCLLSDMMYPPYPVAERIHKKMAAGEYSSEDDFFIGMESLIWSASETAAAVPAAINARVPTDEGISDNRE